MKKAEILERIEDISTRLETAEYLLTKIINANDECNTNLVHPSFWMRAFAVLGHYIAAIFAIYLGVMVLALGVTLVDALVNLF